MKRRQHGARPLHQVSREALAEPILNRVGSALALGALYDGEYVSYHDTKSRCWLSQRVADRREPIVPSWIGGMACG